MVIILITSGGGGWRNTEFRYAYLDDIERYVSTCVRSNNNILGTSIYNCNNSTIDFIFKANSSYGYGNSGYLFVFGIGSQRGETTYGVGDNKLTSNINIPEKFIDFSRAGYNRYSTYGIDLADDIYHHYAITIENNKLFKIYLDGKFVLSHSYDIPTPTTFAVNSLIYVFNYRVSKGLRWTEEFIGQTPLDDVRWTIKENDNNVYGVKKG